MGATRKHWLVVGDPLRGVAAFGVLLFHGATWTALARAHGGQVPSLGPAGRVLFNLDAGVFLFFLLSGYLIGRAFASAFVLQTPFPSFARFARRRFLRLAPGVLAATVLAIVAFGSHFTRGTVHFWTLSAEAGFYLALPLAAAAVLPLTRHLRGPRLRAAAWVAACALVSVLSLWFRSRGAGADGTHGHILPSVAFAFAPGLALAGLEPVLEPLVRERPRRAQLGARLLCLLGSVAAVGYFAVARGHFMQHSVLAVSAAAAFLAGAVVRDWTQLPPWRSLDNRPLQWLGERSYSLYLFHLVIVSEVVRVTTGIASAGLAVVVVIAISVPISLVAAAIGYRTVERPFMRQRAAPAPAQPVAVAMQAP